MFVRSRIHPLIVFNGNDDNPGGGNSATLNPDEYLPGDEQLSDDDFKAKRGFPRKTDKNSMEPQEREHYWRYQSKKQQHTADTRERELNEWRKLGDREELQNKLTDDEKKRREGLDDNQKAVEDARVAARTTAEADARAKYLRPAIEGQVMALTRTAGESLEDAKTRVAGALEFVDMTKFMGDNGELDADKIQTFAQSIAPKDGNDGNGGGDPLHQSYGRETLPPAGATGSVAAHRKAAYDARTTKKQ